MQTIEQIASDLEHFATVLHDQVRRGYSPANADTWVKLQESLKLLEDVSEELCEAQEEHEAQLETEADLNAWLNGDAVRASLASLSAYKR